MVATHLLLRAYDCAASGCWYDGLSSVLGRVALADGRIPGLLRVALGCYNQSWEKGEKTVEVFL